MYLESISSMRRIAVDRAALRSTHPGALRAGRFRDRDEWSRRAGRGGDARGQRSRRAAPSVDDNQLAATKDIASILRARMGEQHELWIKDIASSHELVVDVVLDTTGEIIAEPPFIARRAEARFAVYAAEAPPSRPERFRIEDAGFAVKLVGEPLVPPEAA